MKIDSRVDQCYLHGGVIRVRANFGATFRERIASTCEPPLMLPKRDVVSAQDAAPPPGTVGPGETRRPQMAAITTSPGIPGTISAATFRRSDLASNLFISYGRRP